MSKKEESPEERDANLASLVHHTVSTTNDYIKVFDKMLESSSNDFFLSREIIQSLRTIMWTNSTLVSNLFEESQRFMDFMQKYASKMTDPDQTD